MTRRTLHIVPAALAFLAAVFVTGAAMAQCPSGSYQCGADYCTPDGAVCCAGVGLPQYYCPGGSSCQSDGSCDDGSSDVSSYSSSSSYTSSSSTTGGGGYCPSGSYSCGADYCTPNGAVCCASVGNPQYYCPSGSICQSDGSCDDGSSSNDSSSYSSASSTTGGGYCPSGSYSCGADYCTPDGAVCCASVGNPQYYCPSGSICQSDGSCDEGGSSNLSSASSSSGTTGGGECPSNSYSCGDDYCTPLGEVCCASVGNPQYYCPSGTICQSDGGCDDGSSSSDSSSTGLPSSTNDSTSSGTSGGGTNGTGTSGSPPPQIEGCSTYYDHGYEEYQVEVQCQSAYAYACAGHQEGINASCDILEGWGYGSREACPYCTGTDPRENSGPPASGKKKKSGGCAVSPNGSPAGETLFALALLGFAGVLRRRSERRAT